jgi:hypothetical protein
LLKLSVHQYENREWRQEGKYIRKGWEKGLREVNKD